MNNKQLDKLKTIYKSLICSEVITDPITWVYDNCYSPESARSSNIDLNLTPYLKEPFLTAIKGSDENGNIIHNLNLLCNTGAGKSTFYTVILNYIFANRPAPSAVIFQNEQEATTFGETRLFPVMKNNPKLRDIYPDDRKHARKMQLNLAGNPLYLLSATRTQLQSKSLTYVIGDECWLYKQGMIEEAIRRTHDRPNRMVLMVSQGGTKGDDWDNYIEKGRVKKYSWKCPHCGKNVIYDWAHLHWDRSLDPDTEKMDMTAFEESIYMQCPFCEEKYHDSPTNRRLLSDSGSYIELHDNSKLSSHLTYVSNALACYWIPWSTLVLEFLEANDHLKETGDRNKLNQFLQKRLAQNVNVNVSDENIERIVAFKQAHKKIQVPQLIEGQIKAKVMGVDVQADCFYFTVYAYTTDDKLWMLDCGKLKTFLEIEDIRKYYEVPTEYVAVDCGYNTNEVIYMCNQMKYYPVNCTSSSSFIHNIKGKKVELLYSTPQYSIINSKNCGYFKFSSRGLKEYTYQKFMKNKNIILYDDLDKFYVRSLTAEVRVPYKDPSTQTIKYKYESKGNVSHIFDATIMSVGLLMVRKIF